MKYSRRPGRSVRPASPTYHTPGMPGPVEPAPAPAVRGVPCVPLREVRWLVEVWLREEGPGAVRSRSEVPSVRMMAHRGWRAAQRRLEEPGRGAQEAVDRLLECPGIARSSRRTSRSPG